MENNDEMKFEFAENALDFICSSLEHIHGSTTTPTKTDIKYGILHLYAGLELILKYRLSKEHWSLLFQKIENASKEKLNSGDFQSVNSKSCIQRLKKICNVEISEVQERQINSLRQKRNKMEHFSIVDSIEATKVSFNDVLHFVLEFIGKEFDKSEFAAYEATILEEIREFLSTMDEFINHRLQELNDELQSLKSNCLLVACPKCNQITLPLNDEKKCLFCNYNNNDETLAEEFIEYILGISSYETIKGGGEFPQYDCVECSNHTMVHNIENTDHPAWFCFSCGFDWKDSEINFCDVCAGVYTESDKSFGRCNTCLERYYK